MGRGFEAAHPNSSPSRRAGSPPTRPTRTLTAFLFGPHDAPHHWAGHPLRADAAKKVVHPCCLKRLSNASNPRTVNRQGSKPMRNRLAPVAAAASLRTACAPDPLINECDTNNGGCDNLTTCTSEPGLSPTCGACPSGYTGDGSTRCIDIDECATDNGGCDSLTTRSKPWPWIHSGVSAP
jgi:hypothetical protein